jgi:hypothetical protein
MWRDFESAEIDAAHVISNVASATDLAREIVEYARSGSIRYPRI